MKIKVEERNCVSVVRLRGDLTGQTSLGPTLLRLMDRRCHRIVLELSGVDMLGSANLTHLIELTARSNSMGGRIVFASPSPFVAGVLATTKLDKYFEVYDDVEAAICAAT